MLLRCVAGLEHPKGGYFAINGEVWQDDASQIFLPTHQRSLSYVFQEASLFPHITVRKNLEYGQRRVPARLRKVSFDQAIGLLGIENLLDRRPDKLSCGERQRAASARALLTSPSLLLLDEPLAALDLKRKKEILPYLERLHDELGTPVLFVSHSPDEVAQLADYLVLIKQWPGGRLLSFFSKLQEEHRLFLDQLNDHLTDYPELLLWLRRLFMKASARNQWFGKVTEIQVGAVTAEVFVTLNGGATLVASITNDSVTALGLTAGKEVLALVCHECIQWLEVGCNAVREMRVGPSEAASRRSFQTALSCCR